MHLKAPNADSGCYMQWILGRCLGLLSGKQWKTLKSAVAPTFQLRAVIDSIPRTRAQISNHFHALEKTGNLRQSLIHPAQDLKKIPFLNVAETIYGPLSFDSIAELDGLVPSRERLFMHLMRGGLTRFQFSRYLPLAANRELWKFKNAWRKFNDKQSSRLSEKTGPTLSSKLYTMAGTSWH